MNYSEKRELRKFYNDVFSENITNIRQAFKALNVTTSAEAYKELIKEKKIVDEIIRKEEARIARAENKKKAISWSQKGAQSWVKSQVAKKNKMEEERYIRKQILNMRVKNLNRIDIDLSKFKSIGDALKYALTEFERMFQGKKYNIIVNGVHYAINNNTKKKLLDRIMSRGVSTTDLEGSDAEFVAEINHIKKFTIELFTPTNTYKKANGAFFKYKNNTQIDLSRYQIYNTICESYDNCLVYALQQGGLCIEKLNELRTNCKSGNIPLCKFEEICTSLKIRINVKKMKTDAHSEIKVYGKSFEEVYNIGLLDEHFFIIEPTEYTNYCIKHYDNVKDQINYNNIVGMKENNTYYRNKTSYIDSFKLISLFLEYKEELLTQINKFEITHSEVYNKVNDDILDLHYIPSINNNYKPVETNSSKKDKSEFINIFFDFETSVINSVHVPYLCCFIDDNNNKSSFIGTDCGFQLLYYLNHNLKYKNVKMIAHNSSYDIRFLYKYLKNVKEINKGTKVISCSAKFNNMNIEIKDSLLLIAMPLKNFPKTFKISDLEKEVMSYKMYNETDCIKREMIPIQEAIEWLEKENKDVKQFLANIKRWDMNIEGYFNCIDYSRRYCEIDCYILKEGYNTFKKWMNELVHIDIDSILTIASLAHRYFIESKCYEGVNELSGHMQAFIQKCVVGGRVMCANNKKQVIVNKRIMDFDAVSLYPSAMSRMDGFLKGLPKVIEKLDYNELRSKDGYFIEIKIKSVGIKRKFPLLSYKNEDGIRMFTNDLVGRTIHIDKIALEDAIKYQDITFDIVRGYYFDEGFNTEINQVIRNIFNERVNLKKNKNPAEIVYKLIMNSGYGKSIMKEIDSECVYFNNKDEMNVFLSRNYNWLLEYEQLADSNLYKVKLIKSINTHFNIAQVGVSILSWSKRIMNEVMCLAEDSNIDIYYQDTDSMHLLDSDISILANKYTQLYGRELIGEQLGQFHSDFDLAGCKDVYARNSIFLGKKCYIDELVGKNSLGEEEVGYHIRMKGIPSSCITWKSQQLGCSNVFELYDKLYNGEKIEFDLTMQGQKDNFKFEKNGQVTTLKEFTRSIKF